MKSLSLLSIFMIFILIWCSKENKNSTDIDDSTSQSLCINEVLAINDSNLTDEYNEFDDWIEIYNESSQSVDLGGMFLSDDPGNLSKYFITTSSPGTTTIPAYGHLLLWADNDSEQGILHLNFKLNGDGEVIYLSDSDGATIIDSVSFSAQSPDTSWGRESDGVDSWINFPIPTPGESNS